MHLRKLFFYTGFYNVMYPDILTKVCGYEDFVIGKVFFILGVLLVAQKPLRMIGLLKNNS